MPPTEEEMYKALQQIMNVIEDIPELDGEFTEKEARNCDEGLSEIYGILEDLGVKRES